MTYVPRLFCGCGAEMKPEKIGQIVEVFVHDRDTNPRPPKAYYKISADILKCIACGSRVLLNAPEPVALEHQSNYHNYTASHSAWLK